MKRLLLLLLVAVPLIAQSQTTSVIWNTVNPTNGSNITGGTMAGAGGVTVENNGWSGFRINGFQTGNGSNMDNSKYISFPVTAPSGYSISLSSFTFTYMSPSDDNGPKKLDLYYSTDASLLGTKIGSTENLTRDNANHILTFNLSGNTLNAGTTGYLKIFVYKQNNTGYGDFYLRNTYNGVNGPTLDATAFSMNAPASATNDSAIVNPNTSAIINVLSNDTAGTGATFSSVSVTTAAQHGYTTVNTDKTITYTPATGYTGTDSFTYTFVNSNNVSKTATVNITVQMSTPTSGPLNGTYYVGAGGNFSTITQAVTYLNANGVSGAVKFLLSNTTYSNTTGETFPITINSFSGSSATNTVTFKPAVGKTVLISAVNPSSGWSPIPTVFKINGGDYIIFDGSNTTAGTTRNLTINNQDVTSSTDRSIIWLASDGSNGATHNTVKNCVIKMQNKNASSAYCVGIFSGNTTTNNNDYAGSNATADNSYITVTNNKFNNVKHGVYVNGGTTVTTNVSITHNDLGAENNTETIVAPTRLNNVNTFTFSENYIYNLFRDNTGGNIVSAAIYVSGNSTNGTISKNDIKDLTKTSDNGSYFAGIVLESSAPNSQILVANNFINRVVGTGSGGAIYGGHGIIVASGGGYKIYHNSVVLKDNASTDYNASSGYAAAIFIGNNVSTLDVRNNIFVNQMNNINVRKTAITVNKQASTLNTVFPNGLDYNIYYSNEKIGYVTNQWSISDVSSFNTNNPDYIVAFDTWKSTTGQDAHTLNILPEFISATDLHINPYGTNLSAYNNKGTAAFITTVPKDIDGQVRNTTTPDIGADEFGPLSMPEPGSNTGVYCDASTTWDGDSWSNGNPLEMTAANALSIDVIFTGNYTQNGGSFNACSVFVTSGADVDFTNNANALVKHSVNVETGSSLTFESGTTLRQIENDQNSGVVTIKRYGSKLKRLDYSIWSAPVYDYRGSSSVAGQDFQSLHDFSPLTSTSPTSRFFTYNTTTDLYESIDPFTNRFQKGRGVLIRMPNQLYALGGGITVNQDYLAYNAGTYRFSYLGQFEGTPNNGDIRVDLVYVGAQNRCNMVGNPYPSPISVKAFLDENAEIIDGTIWLWRKTNNAAETSYSTITKMAYVANAAPGGTSADGNDLIGNPFILDIDGDGELDPIINVGQGFLVGAKTDDELVFNNSMRVSHNYNQFFRTGDFGEGQSEPTFSRYWLNMKNNDGAFSQLAVGYSAQTTNAYDNGYDGELLAGGTANMYTVMQVAENDTKKLTIDARSSFENTNTVALGFKSNIASQYEISLDHFDGLFEGDQAIYLVDNLTGNTTNLKEGAYTFTTESGTFDGRFEIVYTTESSLGTDVPVINEKEVIAFKNGSQVNITAPKTIKAVAVYDMLGRQLYSNNNVNNTDFQTAALTTAQQVVIVKVTLENQQVVSKKIMMD